MSHSVEKSCMVAYATDLLLNLLIVVFIIITDFIFKIYERFINVPRFKRTKKSDG